MNGWQVFVEVAGRPPFEIRPGESIVGRSRLAQVHIPESTVSRQHARILLSPIGEVTVEDLGSSNGTYVNSEKIEGRRRLSDGDRIHVGDAELRVRIVAPVAPAEATVRMSLPPMSGPPPAVPLPPAPPPIDESPLATPPLPQAVEPGIAAPPAVVQAPVPPPRVDPPLFTQPVQAPAPPPVAPAPIPPPAPSPAPSPSPVEMPPAAPRPSPASRPTVPVVAPPAAPAPPPSRPSSMRQPALPSVTLIDRIPIPEATPEVIRASKLARAAPAGFGVRLAAFLIDAALMTFVAIPVWIVAFTALRGMPEIATLLVPGILSVISLLYTVVFWATKGATPGKMFLRLRIIGARPGPTDALGWGPAILRTVGYMASSALFGLGFLLILVTSQRQGLHDLIAGTRVVRLR